MATRADRHDQQRELPQGARIQRVERPQVRVWQQGQHDQRARGQDQRVDQLVAAQHRAQRCRRDRAGGRVQPERQRQQQGGPRGHALARVRRPGQQQQGQPHLRQPQQHRPAQVHGDRAQQRGQRETAYARGRARQSCPLAPLALHADQQADAQRDGEWKWTLHVHVPAMTRCRRRRRIPIVPEAAPRLSVMRATPMAASGPRFIDGRQHGPRPPNYRKAIPVSWSTRMYQRILVPVDGSPTSDRGLQEAIRLAQLTHGELRLIHVIDELVRPGHRQLWLLCRRAAGPAAQGRRGDLQHAADTARARRHRGQRAL